MMGMTEKKTTTHKLHSKPLKQLYRHDLPASYELEDWESEDDIWFRTDGNIYNVNEFCTVGMPRIPGPYGGSQMASNGYFAIAASGEGELHRVISTTITEIIRPEWMRNLY